MKNIKAVCTWGDGPDVLLVSNGYPTFNLSSPEWRHSIHGIVKKWQVDLTSDEAIKLANDLNVKGYGYLTSKNMWNKESIRYYTVKWRI